MPVYFLARPSFTPRIDYLGHTAEQQSIPYQTADMMSRHVNFDPTKSGAGVDIMGMLLLLLTMRLMIKNTFPRAYAITGLFQFKVNNVP